MSINIWSCYSFFCSYFSSLSYRLSSYFNPILPFNFFSVLSFFHHSFLFTLIFIFSIQFLPTLFLFSLLLSSSLYLRFSIQFLPFPAPILFLWFVQQSEEKVQKNKRGNFHIIYSIVFKILLNLQAMIICFIVTFWTKLVKMHV